jgi:hypothetical protein
MNILFNVKLRMDEIMNVITVKDDVENVYVIL